MPTGMTHGMGKNAGVWDRITNNNNPNSKLNHTQCIPALLSPILPVFIPAITHFTNCHDTDQTTKCSNSETGKLFSGSNPAHGLGDKC